ncbi:MAG: calcium/sodium antiporter [Rubricoccaceae bacterium]|nr:calcium/sodium antiporter [Rubricoccaceae bacterium]
MAGLAFLLLGAEALVRGASRLAALLGLSPLIIGLTVVAFGTSAPELAVSVDAALSGQGGIAVGNVVGSNIVNVLFILGLAALIVPLTVDRQLIRLDVPLMIALSALVWLLSLDTRIGRTDGLLLVAGLLAYVGFLIWQGRREPEQDEALRGDERPTQRHWLWDAVWVAGGLALLVLGSRWLVGSAVSFAQQLGVSEAVIGLTVVAAGTSMPEVVTSIVAAVRGQRDIAVGNVVGSNVFNLMGVLGVASLVGPGGIGVPASVVNFDLPVMGVVAFSCLPIFFTGGVISRAEGALFLAYYVGYTLYLILDATGHDALPQFSAALASFALPLTLLTLLLLATREARRRTSNPAS